MLSPFRLFSLSSRSPSFYYVFSLSVRRNSSVTTQISPFVQGNQRPRVPPPITDFPAFRRYLQGHYTEPYGRQGKESRDLFIRSLTRTFESVADAQRLSWADTSDTPKLINTADFLYDVFEQAKIDFRPLIRSFDRSVKISYDKRDARYTYWRTWLDALNIEWDLERLFILLWW